LSKIYFLIGGARSGKSEYSEQLATSTSNKFAYLATARIIDEEMEKRIACHRKRRPESWKTFEFKKDAIEIREAEEIFSKIISENFEVVVIDCITNLLFRLIYRYNLDNIEIIDNALEKEIEKEAGSFFEKFLEILKSCNLNIIIVSNEVGLGVVPPYPFGRIFRDLMGIVNKRIAAASDEVYFFMAGLAQRMK
jgi:adenosylcobinamide kinase / adenosylcobinamide-phosphate guanylyltransferase